MTHQSFYKQTGLTCTNTNTDSKNPHKRTRVLGFRLILFQYIRCFLQNQAETILKVLLKLLFRNYKLSTAYIRLPTDEINMQAQHFNLIKLQQSFSHIHLAKSKNNCLMYSGNSHTCCKTLCVPWSSTYSILIYLVLYAGSLFSSNWQLFFGCIRTISISQTESVLRYMVLFLPNFSPSVF